MAATTNINTFSRRIRARANLVGNSTTKMVRRVALSIDTALVMETPVDTGRAKSNWIVAINFSPDRRIQAYAPGSKGSTETANMMAALSQGERVITGYESGKDQEIYITNSLPYIGELNEGSSYQAPAMFIQTAIAAAVAAARRARL